MPALSKTGQYRYENTVGIRTGAMNMRGKWGGSRAGGTKMEEEARMAVEMRVTTRYDEVDELPRLQEDMKTMMPHLKAMGSLVSEQIDIVLSENTEPPRVDEGQDAPPTPIPPNTPSPAQLDYLRALIGGNTKRGPIKPPEARQDVVERRAEIVGMHLSKATKHRDTPVKRIEDLTDSEASNLIDDLLTVQPKRR